MKKRFKLLLIPLAIFLIFSSLASVYRIVPLAKATYVWGTVTQDTYWTLVDSPFIVSDNIQVNPGATLTIEPGVQVRFGQNFTITVNGGITADGTVDRPILFTSNSLNASKGDWGTILINGTEHSSITNCIIEYGTNGTTLESGSLNLQNNDIAANLDGTVVNGGNVTIQNNMITNNTVCGVNIAGGSQVTAENNTISSNGDGIVLTGTLTGKVDVAQNNILLNNNSGISVDASADYFYNTTIIRNNVSSNKYGFLVTSNGITYITHNYVSNNTKDGIFYENGTSHEAHFNDIYNNTVGMDVYANNFADPFYIVNATYNYWGDPSGPLHTFLNPYGKGNSVGGDGVDLRFIFSLSKPSDYTNTPPTAVLQTDKTLVAPSENVTFIGTNSFDDGRVDQYFYDFGDGDNTGWTTLTLFNHAYSAIGNYTASLMVMDDFGNTSQINAIANIDVQNLSPLSVSISPSNEEVYSNGNVSVAVYVSNDFGPMGNVPVTLLSLKGGTFSQQQGVTNETGYFETTFTAPNVTDTTFVRLIASASEASYADGSSYAYLKVLPPLEIGMTTNPAIVKSEAAVAVTFYVSNGLKQPVGDASLTANTDNGAFLTNVGLTDTNGSVTFNFVAPYTLSPLNVTFTASAQKAGYTDGYSQQTITVLQNVLAVNLSPSFTTIVSEGNTSLTALVTCDAVPVPNANVTVSSSNEGNFISTTALADSNGFANFLFTAPQTTSLFNATITATASKSHYIDGTGQAIFSIVPKILIVYLTAQNYTVISEANVSITVQVTYNVAPVQEANVTLTSNNGGNFSQFTETTDARGFATFFFTAPQANEPTGVTLMAHCSKIGYADGQDFLTLTVNPGNISVQVTAASYAIKPRSSVVVTASAEADSRPVVGAQVNITTNFGTFSTKTGLTDVNGTCRFVFNAPSTNAQVVISANVTKNGYIGNGSQTTINVNIPATTNNNGGGFSGLTMLLIIIPVIVAVIVVVLIKLKVIVVSAGGESGDE